MTPAVRHGLLVLAGIVLAQTAWVLALPPFRGSDEFDHAYRAAGVASGQWRLTEPAETGRGLLVVVPGDLVESASAQCEDLPYTETGNCHPITHLGGGRVTVATAAGSYNPVYYWVVGTAARPFDGTASVYAMRVSSALLAAVFVALAAWSLTSWAPGRWARLGFLGALTPTLVYSTVVVAPNGPEMAAGLCLWTSLMALGATRPGPGARREVALIAVATVSAVAMTGLRTLGPLYCLLIIATVVLFRGVRPVAAVFRRRPAASVLATIVVSASAVAGLLWSRSASLFSAAEFNNQARTDWSYAVRLPEWMFGLIGTYPYRNQAAPPVVFACVLLVVLPMLAVAVRRSAGRERLALVTAALLTQLVPVALVAATLNSRGGSWQGRYILPILVGVLPVAGALIDSSGWRPRIPSTALVLVGGLLLLAAQVVCVVDLQQVELTRAASAGDAAWVHPPTAVTALVMVLAGVFLLRSLTPDVVETA